MAEECPNRCIRNDAKFFKNVDIVIYNFRKNPGPLGIDKATKNEKRVPVKHGGFPVTIGIGVNKRVRKRNDMWVSLAIFGFMNNIFPIRINKGKACFKRLLVNFFINHTGKSYSSYHTHMKNKINILIGLQKNST